MKHLELMAELHKRGFYSALQEYVNDLSSNESFEVWEDLVKQGAAVIHFHLNEYGKLVAEKTEFINESDKEIARSEREHPIDFEVKITAKKKPK